MTPEERKAEFLDISAALAVQRERLKSLAPELTLYCDTRAVHFAIWDLDRTVENCIVVGHHQVGDYLEDEMGFAGPVQPIHWRERGGRRHG